MAKGLELRRRSLERFIKCKSETVHMYLNERGGQLYGAIERVATMYQYTDDNVEHRAAVEANFKPLFDDLLSSVNEIEREGKSFARANKKLDQQKIVVPEHYNHQVPFTHWLFNDVIDSLEKIDSMVSRLEVYWIRGIIDDSQMRNIRIRSIRPFGQFTNRIYEITNKLRSMSNGGRMRDQVRRQVMTSFLEDIPEYDGDISAMDSDVSTGTNNTEGMAVTDIPMNKASDFPVADMAEMALPQAQPHPDDAGTERDV